MTEENIELAAQSKLKRALAEILVLIIVQCIAIIFFYGFISEFYKPVTFMGIDTSKYQFETVYSYGFFSFLVGVCLSYFILKNFRERYLMSNAQTKSYDLFLGRQPSNFSPLFSGSFSRKTLYVYCAVTFCMIFFVGILIILNGYLDKSLPQYYIGHVTDRYRVHHRGTSSYKAVFDIPVTSNDHVLHSTKPIGKGTYERLEIGITPVNLTLRDGFFGMQWVEKADVVLSQNSWNKTD